MGAAVDPGARPTLQATVAVFTVAGWLALVAIVLSLDPNPLPHRVAFFAAFFLAVSGAAGMGAYRLSFSLFASRRYRGNFARSLQQGAVTGVVLTVAAVLQAERALSLVTAGLLAVLFVALQIVVLLRR